MTKCVTFKRARSEEQIEQRINVILDAAASLFAGHRFDEISFAMIGKEANFTRSNLYRYFDTKEEIFLQLLVKDIQDWRSDLDILLDKNSNMLPVEAWVDTLLNRPRLLQLFNILSTLLEHNVTDEGLKKFKLQSYAAIESICRKLVDNTICRDLKHANDFIITHVTLISGLYSMYAKTERQKAVMVDIGHPHNAQEIRQLMIQSVRALF